ncbi:MAG: response regulator [Methanoregula sp.]|nr:response regulator [Methanoregula sp.]
MNDTIMIVDDSSFIVDGLVAILKRAGYKPIPALSGDECLEILKTTTPDIILLDILMEPMDGWETLDRLKSNPATKGIPVIMFSAKKISPSEVQEHSKNIDDFVPKPVNPVQLMESIQRIFNRRNDVKVEALVAHDAGLDKALIDEYVALRTSIEVDKNLLIVLKNSTGANTPGHVVPADDLAAMQKLEEQIRTDEQRLKEISETGLIPPKPIETSSLTEGSICSRCGNRVPPGSMFCNHCGTKVILSGEPLPVAEPPASPALAPVAEPSHVPPVTPAMPVVAPSYSISETPTPPVITVPHERVIRPIEEVIHSNEPLIEDSVPRTEPAPLIKREIPVPSFATSTAPVIPAGTPAPQTPVHTPSGTDVTRVPATPDKDAPARVPPSLHPVPEFRPKSTKSRALMIAAVVIVILVIALGAFVILKPL